MYGRKHSSVYPHPGTEVPCGTLTDTCSAEAKGIVVIIIPVRIIEVSTNFLILFITSMIQNENKRLRPQICLVNYPYLIIDTGISLAVQKNFKHQDQER